MHSLIASPFLEQHTLVRPGSRGGALLPEARYEELRTHDPGKPAPAWLVDAVLGQWPDLGVTGRPSGEYLLVRQPSSWGYGKASWEVNLGCNYDCKHCYLGLKMQSGMPWAAAGTEDCRRIGAYLDDALLGGEVFLDESSHLVYFLVPPTVRNRWEVPGSECLVQDSYLGVPYPDPGSDEPSRWLLGMGDPGALCRPDAVKQFVMFARYHAAQNGA